MKAGDRVRLKPDVACDLQTKYGKFNHMFKNLVGLVGTIEKPDWRVTIYKKADWTFKAGKKRFEVMEDELEPVPLLGGE